MVIENVHGLQATSISLNERFTMLASAAPLAAKRRPVRPVRPTIGSFLEQSLNFHDRALIEQIARILQQQAKKRALRQRLGVPGLRSYGSEGNMPGLQQENNVRRNNFQNAQQWKQNSFWNLNRASFNNASGGGRKRGGPRQPQMRRGGGVGRQRGRVGLAAARMAALRRRLRAAPSRAALDAQLERYMSLAPAALDRQLEQYHAAQPPADLALST